MHPIPVTFKKRKGFTLVELIVVVGVLLALSVLAVTAYSNVRRQVDDALRESDANTVANAMNAYNSVAQTPLAAGDINEKYADGYVELKTDSAAGDQLTMDFSVHVNPTRWPDPDDYNIGDWIVNTGSTDEPYFIGRNPNVIEEP